MEVDGQLVMVAIAKATGHLLDDLDLAVEALGSGIGDAVLEVREHVRQVSLERLGRFLDRLKSRMRRHRAG